MIEKILKNVKWHQLKKVIPDDQIVIDQMITKKINELVDAVNGILAMQEQYATIYNEDIVPMLTPENKEPADPYAEQRKWIGKLCKVYDDNDFVHYAVLEKIWDNSDYCYGTPVGDYKHCEPASEDLIYKGGNNE